MNETGKEIMCAQCAHREVCERKSEYQNAAVLANDIVEESMTKVYLQLRDIPWVRLRPPEVTCDYFMRRRKMATMWDNGGTNE